MAFDYHGLVWAIVYAVTFAQTYKVYAKAALQKGVHLHPLNPPLLV